MRRFRLYGASERTALAQALNPVLKSWSREWIGEDVVLSAVVATPDRLPFDGKRIWRSLSHQDAVIRYALSPGFSRRVAVEAGWCDAAATRKASSIWDETIFDCIDALARQILAKATGKQSGASFDGVGSVASDSDGNWSAYASGYLCYDLALGQESLTFVLGPDVVMALSGEAPRNAGAEALASRLSAVGGGALTLELVAGAAEVTVGELHALSPGHVIQLENVIGHPFKLRTLEGQEIGSGYLAACGENKAVQLAKNV